MNRRRFLRAAGVVAGASAAALGANASFVEPYKLTLTRHRLRGPSVSAAERVMRIVQLTDLHLQSVGTFHERIAREVSAARPDVIVITGDSIDRDDALPLLGEFLSLLDPATAKFATWGNWEHYLDIGLEPIAEMYARHGCRVLNNESAVLYVNGNRLLITGLDSAQDGHPDLERALAGVEVAANHVVLAHCPIQRDQVVAHVKGVATAGVLESVPVVRHSPSVVLSGHTHGGQITFGGWAPVTPVGSGRYVSGW